MAGVLLKKCIKFFRTGMLDYTWEGLGLIKYVVKRHVLEIVIELARKRRQRRAIFRFSWEHLSCTAFKYTWEHWSGIN